jgi:hypothetical protein
MILVIFGDILGTVARLFLLSPTCRKCPLRSFLGIGLMLDISFWGTCGLRTVSWILFSEKLYLMTLCTSFVLYKVKNTFGDSRWKLRELTRVSRFLAYVKIIQLQYNACMTSIILSKPDTSNHTSSWCFLLDTKGRESWESSKSHTFLCLTCW